MTGPALPRRRWLAQTPALVLGAWLPPAATAQAAQPARHAGSGSGLPAPASVAAAAMPPLALRPFGPGTWVAEAVNAEPARANAGAVVPSLVVLAGDGVLVVDPGPHLRWGRRLLAAIRRLTPLPVRWVVNTHAHPEHVLGNAAFAALRPRPVFVASPQTAALMRARCAACLDHLRALLGAGTLAGTGIVLPAPALRDGARFATGSIDWRVRVFADAHSPSDTVLYAPASGLLCAGGLATRQRVPDLREGSLAGWQAALRELLGWEVRRVAGAGVGTPAQTLAPTLAYLDALEADIARAWRSGGDAADAARAVPGDGFRHWRGFSPRHALNVQRAWLELEDRYLREAPPG